MTATTSSVAKVGLLSGALVLAACTRASAPATPPPPSAGASFDRTFMETVTDKHQIAIEMFQLCQQKAQAPDLKQYCSEELAKPDETATMQEFLRRWYQIERAPQKPKDLPSIYRSFMPTIRTAVGKEFEEAFLRGIRQHHRQDIEEAGACATKASHPELQQVCRGLVADHQRELQKVDRWICVWFKDCV